MERCFFFNESFEILADTDTLDLDPRSFSSRIEIVEFDLQNNQDNEKIKITTAINIAVRITKVFLSLIAVLRSLAFWDMRIYPTFSSSIKTFLIVDNLNLL